MLLKVLLNALSFVPRSDYLLILPTLVYSVEGA